MKKNKSESPIRRKTRQTMVNNPKRKPSPLLSNKYPAKEKIDRKRSVKNK